jgi:hypothetical protein
LIDDTLAKGTKSGYLFVATPQTVGTSVATNALTVSTIPQNYNQSGVRAFCSNEDAVIRSSNTATPTQQTADSGCATYTVLQ